METGQGYGLGIGGCKRLCPAANGAQLGYTVSLSVSVKDRSLHWVLGKSQTYYPAHILVYGHWEDLLLFCRGFRLFPDRLIGGGDGGGLSTALSPGLRSGGLESKFGRRPGPHDRRVVGLFCLCLGYKRGMCFGGTQLGTLIPESPGDLIRLVYSLAPQ